MEENNQMTNQTVNQITDQPTNQSENQTLNQSTNQVANQTINSENVPPAANDIPYQVYPAQIPAVPVRSHTETYNRMIEQFPFFGLGCLIYGILFTICLYKSFAGITMPILMVVTIAVLLPALNKLGTEFKKQDIFYVICIMLLGFSNFRTGDGALVFFNTCGIILLVYSFLLGRFCDTSQWGFPKFLSELMRSIFNPIGYLFCFFESLEKYFSRNKEDEKSSKSKYIWLGALLGIPFVIIVTALLASADVVFGNLFSQILDGIRLPRHWFKMLFLLVVGILGTFALLCFFADDKISNEVKDGRTGEPVLAISFLSFSTIIYLIFSVIQIMYLFIGGMKLPEGYTYAKYAHEGFYQLLAVCLINLVVLFICIGKFRENLVLKILLTVFSACTYIMLASSAFRMVLYVKAYQLTYLRLLTLWGLLVIGIALIGCMITIWKNSFPLFPYVMVVVAVLFIALSYARPHYVIAKYNLSDRNASIDTGYLMNLSSDVVPVFAESPEFDAYIKKENESHEEFLKEHPDGYDSRYTVLRFYQNHADEMGILNFNLSWYKAGKVLDQKIGKAD